MASYMEQIQNLLQVRPGMTVKELAAAIFGPDNRFDQRVNPQVSMLMAQGVLRREGLGGNQDPYRYYLAAAPSVDGFTNDPIKRGRRAQADD